MKFTTTTMKTFIGAAGIAAATVLAAPTAVAATPTIQGFGTTAMLVDDGPMITAYTVSNLQPSSSSIPGYAPKGTLYQVDVNARSDAGIVTPMVRNFSARGPNGQIYHLITLPVPNGLNPAPIPQGSESSGKLYFDVTGAPPNGVVYNDGLQDILIWTTNVPGSSAPGDPNSSPVPGAPPSPSPQS